MNVALRDKLRDVQNGVDAPSLIPAFISNERVPPDGVVQGLVEALAGDFEALVAWVEAYLKGIPGSAAKPLPLPLDLERALLFESTQGEMTRLKRVIAMLRPFHSRRCEALAEDLSDAQALDAARVALAGQGLYYVAIERKFLRALEGPDEIGKALERYGQKPLPPGAIDVWVDVARGNRDLLLRLCAKIRPRLLTPSLRIAVAQVLQGDPRSLAKFVKECTKDTSAELQLTVETLADVMRLDKAALLIITYALLDRALPVPDRLTRALRECLRGDVETLRDVFLRGLANRVSLPLEVELVEALRGDREGLRRLIAECGAAGVTVPVVLNEAFQKSCRGNAESLLEGLAARRIEFTRSTANMTDLALTLRGDRQRLLTVTLGQLRRDQTPPAEIVKALARSLRGDGFAVQDFIEKVEERGAVKREEIIGIFVDALRNDAEGLLGLFRAGSTGRTASAAALARVMRGNAKLLHDLIAEDLQDGQQPRPEVINAWLATSPSPDELRRAVAAYEENEALAVPYSLALQADQAS
jgi:hypothetical protein